MAAAIVTNRDLFIHGGLDSDFKPQKDTWMLPFDSNKWEHLEDGPEAKCCHSAETIGPLVVIIGGSGTTNEFSLA